MWQGISLKSKKITHDLNHDLTFIAHTINCVCHSIRSMLLGIHNFGNNKKWISINGWEFMKLGPETESQNGEDHEF
jgi:hypothetical protein